MDDSVAIATVICVIILFVIIICGIVFYGNEKAKEEEELRTKEQAEEERKRNTMCCICGKCSMGYIICDQCYKRAEPIQKELPKANIKDYLTTLKFHKQTINNVIDAKNQEEKEYYAITLIVTSDILQNKYFIPDIWDNTNQFLCDLEEEGTPISKEFIDEYYTKDLADTSSSDENNTKEKSDTPFHCKDGHNVRSKAEREIDNFLYENQVWHIYEYKYEHPVTKEWAIPDFYLPDYNLYIEYFGLNTKEYVEKREHKIKMYRSDPNIKFTYLTYEDDGDIYGKLRRIFNTYNIPLK